MTFLIANHKGALVPFFLAAAVVITSCRSGPQEDMAEVRASETAPAQRRFEFFFKSIREFYRGAGSTSALSEKMVEQDFRQVLMRIEALARLYRDHLPKDDDKRLKEVNESAKALEDRLGGLQDAFKIIDVLKAAKADNDLIKWAENEKVKAKEIFDDYLDESGWGLGLKALDKSETYIAKIDWPKVKPDRQIVLSSLASAADKIANKDYPLDRVEEGIHELRKDIRWILLYAQSLGGLVVRNDHVCPLPQYQPLTQTKLSDSKWGRLPPSVFEPDALEIPGCLYLGLTWHNQNISEAKDIGLWQEHIESLLRHKNPGLNPEQVQQEAARIIRRLPQWVDPVATARAEHVKIKASNILQEFSKAIRE